MTAGLKSPPLFLLFPNREFNAGIFFDNGTVLRPCSHFPELQV